MDICNQNYITSNENCTTWSTSWLLHHQVYLDVETTILSLMLTYIIIANIAVIVVTIGSAELRGCIFSMQFAASYVGNIVSGASLIGNDIYLSQKGIIPLCQNGKDRFVLLYFGISLNLMVLIMNTHYRYQRITSTTKVSDQDPLRTRDVILKNWLPALFVSASICATAVLLQQHYGNYHHFLFSLGISALPYGVAITWNITISCSLIKAQRSSLYLKQDESVAVLQRATFIINTVIVTHTMFLLGCVAANVCTLYLQRTDIAIGVCWFLRVLYFVLFTIEGHVYIYQVKTARDAIKNKLLSWCSSNKDNRPVKVELLSTQESQSDP